MTQSRRQTRAPDWTAEEHAAAHADIAGGMTAWETWLAPNVRPPVWLGPRFGCATG
jgi:hypothetical protein